MQVDYIIFQLAAGTTVLHLQPKPEGILQVPPTLSVDLIDSDPVACRCYSGM
jgi:hypothetical protein